MQSSSAWLEGKGVEKTKVQPKTLIGLQKPRDQDNLNLLTAADYCIIIS